MKVVPVSIIPSTLTAFSLFLFIVVNLNYGREQPNYNITYIVFPDSIVVYRSPVNLPKKIFKRASEKGLLTYFFSKLNHPRKGH